MLQWTPQTQFAGFYVAYEKGFYRRRGLDVLIQQGGPDRDALKALREGEVNFVTMFLPTALIQRERGVPLVLAGQIVNRSSLVLVTRKDRGIRSPRDLHGRRVSLWGEAFEAPYRTLFTALRIAPRTYPQHYSVNLFLRGGVDACSAMYYNECHQIYQAGFDPDEVSLLFLRDLGLGFPEDGIYCLDVLARENPALCRAFFEATLEGWRYAREHPEEAVDLVMNYVRLAQVPTNRTHMDWMLRAILPCIFPASGDSWRTGRLSETDYLRTARSLQEAGLISRFPPYSLFLGEASSDGR
jgi:NitT/TauT family transport system substrate-binding protein